VGDDALEAEDAEVSPTGREVGIGELAYGFEGHPIDYTVGKMADWRGQQLE
jgi:hypothetical protein